MCFRDMEMGPAGDEELVREHLAVRGLDTVSSAPSFSPFPLNIMLSLTLELGIEREELQVIGWREDDLQLF